MTSLSLLSAVIVGCLPPFKSLFEGRGSSQPSKSSGNSKKASPGLELGVIRLGSAKPSPDTTSRPVEGKGNTFDGGHDGGFDVPHGAIGVRNDYVSHQLGWALRKELIDLFVGSGELPNVGIDEKRE